MIFLCTTFYCFFHHCLMYQQFLCICWFSSLTYTCVREFVNASTANGVQNIWIPLCTHNPTLRAVLIFTSPYYFFLSALPFSLISNLYSRFPHLQSLHSYQPNTKSNTIIVARQTAVIMFHLLFHLNLTSTFWQWIGHHGLRRHNFSPHLQQS